MAYDTLVGYLDGTLRYGEAPSTVYVAALKGFDDFVKVGFCQMAFRNKRLADPFIGEMLYESCRVKELQICLDNLSRRQAFLIEQYLHSQLTAYRELIPQLEEEKWVGRYETYRIEPAIRPDFLGWVDHTVGYMAMRGTDAIGEMLDQLVSSGEERELYEDLRRSWGCT
jgi:hypothetical protein